MGKCRLKSPSQRKKRDLKDWNKTAVCLSDGVLIWHADVLGSDPEPKAPGGTALKDWKEQGLLCFFHRKDGKAGFHETLPWGRL